MIGAVPKEIELIEHDISEVKETQELVKGIGEIAEGLSDLHA